jgi:beta-lactamase regulating signal transducer with metallopeptidase domain
VRAVLRTIEDPTEILVLDNDGVADAFVTPGRHGRIIVTSGLMNALTAREREALIAHERSHLDHRHTRWLQAMHGAAAAAPWLRRTCRAIDHAVERWADEDAATVVGDRRLVARTLARASLLKKHGSENARLIAVAATGGDVPARVRALLAPPSTRGRGAALVLILFVVGAALIVVVMQRNADALFDSAQIR